MYTPKASAGLRRVQVSKQARLASRRGTQLVSALALCLWLVPASGFKLDLGKIGEVIQKVVEGTDAFTEVSETREIELGEALAAGLLGAVSLVNDQPVQQYVNQVGLWIALQSERPGLPWHFGVLDTETVNAFAAPGGYVFVTKGLMVLMNNEAELAGVLSHEVSHVVRRHHLAAIQSNARTKLAADVATTMASTQGPLSDALLGVGMELYAKGLDRGDEHESDLRGVVLSARAGYDPYGLPAVLEALASRDPADGSLALMTSTHPSAVERLDALDGALDERFDKFDDLRTVDRRFARIKQRLR